MKKVQKIKVFLKKLYVSPGEVIEIENTLEAMQKLVGGYVELVSLGNGLHLSCDEEGILKGKDLNCKVIGQHRNLHMIHGDFVIHRGGGSFRSLEDDDIEIIYGSVLKPI